MTGEIEFTPQDGDEGEYTLEFIVTDGEGATDKKDAQIVIEGEDTKSNSAMLAVTSLIIIFVLILLFIFLGRAPAKADQKEREVVTTKKVMEVKKKTTPKQSSKVAARSQ